MLYDLIIIGAGPAGLAASIYASRYKLNHLIIGKEIGGTALKAYEIENYPGFKSISGLDLMKKFQEQVQGLGAEIKVEETVIIQRTEDGFEVTVQSGKKYCSRTIILAMGTEIRKLNIPGEGEFLGKGVSYCATCDAAFFKNKVVAVVGGSNAAVSSALLLSEYADKIYIIYRKNKLRAEPTWIEKIENNLKIEVIYNTNLLEIRGNQKVELVVLDKEYKREKDLKLNGVFVTIGSVPAISLAKDLGVEADEENHIKIKLDGSTNVEGVYAAGDMTTGSNKLKQIVAAISEGAVAASGVYQYLRVN